MTNGKHTVSSENTDRASMGDIVLQSVPACSQGLSNALLSHPTMAPPHRDAGLNPLVDAAARLFSIAGKLQRLKSCRDPEKLHADLIAEINAFQESATHLGYSPEYILVSRYAISATLDDVIMQTPWGVEGQWKAGSQKGLLGDDADQSERFFLILERIVHDPGQYIDLMEFMYICLSLGFRGSYQSTEFGHHRLEQISDALYRQIRSHHGDFSRALSPFPVKAPPVTVTAPHKSFSATFVMLITASAILIVFAGLGFVLDAFSDKAHTRLAEIRSTLPYETIQT